MKKLILAFFSAGLLTLTAAEAADEYRIGVVNANEIVEKSPQYDSVRKALDAEFKRRNDDLLAKQNQVKKLEEKKTRDGSVMSAAELKRLEKEMAKLRSERERIGKKLDNPNFVGKAPEAVVQKERAKLEKSLGGIKGMTRLPGAVFVIDPKKELIAVREARKLGVPVVAVVDSLPAGSLETAESTVVAVDSAPPPPPPLTVSSVVWVSWSTLSVSGTAVRTPSPWLP